MIHGAGRFGRAALSVSGEVPHVHFGLGVDGDPHDVGGIVRRLVFRAHVVEDRVGWGDLLQRFGLLHPPQLRNYLKTPRIALKTRGNTGF